MKILLMTENLCDLTDVLYSCSADIDRMTIQEAVSADFDAYDAYCVLGFGKRIDARVHKKLEEAADSGRHVFVEATGSFYGVYSAPPVGTTRSRLIYVDPGDGSGIPGLETGDLLDDEANQMMQPWNRVAGFKPILVYKEHIIAHAHLSASREEILSGSRCGLWMIGDSIMMTSFRLHNFNRARFAPRSAWEKLIRHIARWITGAEPSYFPAPVVQYGPHADLSADETFEKYRREAIERGIGWLKEFLVDEGRGGILEGLHHNIDPEGNQRIADPVRNDCSGEAAGVFRMYAHLYGDSYARTIAENLDSFTYGPMVIKEGIFNGFMRWTDEAWQVCYQDDAARCILPGLYDCLFLGNDAVFPEICRVLDFLVRTTAKNGCRTARTDLYHMNEDSFDALTSDEHGCTSAHYNAYYHAALLLAYKYGKNPVYLETARKGLETLMALYPETRREQSETEEMCRLVLPLAVLYDVTREEKHKEMLYRVVRDLEQHRHPSGGYAEWDTGYKAACSRESSGECSLLTENGDPVADMLYSVNWLPIGFAYAWYATGDEWFGKLWRSVSEFCISIQVISGNPKTDGSWCRAFDMDLHEAYGCPHDAGWATYASESGWTVAEILMGLMMKDILSADKPV